MSLSKVKNPQVKEVFKGYPPSFRKRTLEVRQLIFDTAKELEEVEAVQESLKWGEPSYTPEKRNVGTSIRVSWLKSKPEYFGVYFPCQTDMIARIKRKFGKKFNYLGKRGLAFELNDKLPKEELKVCIRMALRYHLRNKKRK